MNTFLESFKANRWKEGYFWYKPEETRGTQSFYITAFNLSDEKAVALVEDALQNNVDFNHVAAVNVSSNAFDIHNKQFISQVIRFDLTKDHPDKMSIATGTVS